MSMQIDGFKEIESKFIALGNVADKIGKQAVKDGLGVVVEEFKKSGPKDSDGTDHGTEHLAIDNVKKYKSGNTWGKAGITKKNWEKCKGLWYQNFGYEHYKNGKRVEVHLGWMGKIFEKIKPKASIAIQEKVIDEINKLL